jgi:hypothetical protein
MMWRAISARLYSAVITDKYRPETCCIVGNYYSLKAQHEKAVVGGCMRTITPQMSNLLHLFRVFASAFTLKVSLNVMF